MVSSFFSCAFLRYAGRLKAKKRDMVVEGEFHHKEKVKSSDNCDRKPFDFRILNGVCI